MMMLVAMIADLGPYAWFIAGALLLTAEVIVPGVNLIWFGAAATLTGALALGWPALSQGELDWRGQMVAFIALAAVAVVLARVLTARRTTPEQVNLRPEANIGRELVLAEPIVGGTGRATWRDSLWRVTGPDLPAGARVRVTAVEASTFHVEAADAAGPPA